MQQRKIDFKLIKAIEVILLIGLIATLIKLPKILNNGITLDSENWGMGGIISNFYFPIFIDVLLIISIIIVIWRRMINTYLNKEKPDKTLQITFIILALLCLIVSFNSYRNTYAELRHYDYIIHHTSEHVKNVTIHKEELDGAPNRYYVSFAEGTKYEVDSRVYYTIKAGFDNGNLEDDISYVVPEKYTLSIGFLINDARVKTKITGVGITWD